MNIPYPGITGPGYASRWSSTVDFSQVNDNTPFESLPAELQQHLVELRHFMNAERGAAKAIAGFLNESNPTITGDASFRSLTRRIATLQGGEHAIDTVAVDGVRLEKETQLFSQQLDRFESEIRDYTHLVWDPMVEQQGLNASTRSASSAPRPVPRSERNPAAGRPFTTLVDELDARMSEVSRQVEELELALLPLTKTNSSLGGAAREGRWGSAAATSGGGSSVTRTGGFGGVGGSVPSVTPGDAQSQVNVSLGNELATLTSLSNWASRLHTRSNTARELFTRQYGPAEADALFTPPPPTTNGGGGGVSGGGGVGGSRRWSLEPPLELPQLPVTGPTPTVMGQPAAAPAGLTSGGFGSTGLSSFGAGSLGTSSTTTTTGGFGAAAAAPTTTTGFGATAGTGFGGGGAGFGAAAGAPATTGFGATPAAASAAPGPQPAGTAGVGFGAPSLAPASASGAAVPGGFSLGPPAVQQQQQQSSGGDAGDVRPDRKSRR